MNTTECPNCGYENKNTNIRCEFCGAELNHTEQNDNFLDKDYSQIDVKKIKRVISVILIVILAPWFLVGLAFIGVSTYSNFSDNNKSKNYLETEGKLVDYDSYKYDEGDDLYTAVYEYTVNDITYIGSPNLISNKSKFKQTATVKYNPDNPAEYVMDSEWNTVIITGVMMIIAVLVIFILLKKSLENKIKNLIAKQ